MSQRPERFDVLKSRGRPFEMDVFNYLASTEDCVRQAGIEFFNEDTVALLLQSNTDGARYLRAFPDFIASNLEDDDVTRITLYEAKSGMAISKDSYSAMMHLNQKVPVVLYVHDDRHTDNVYAQRIDLVRLWPVNFEKLKPGDWVDRDGWIVPSEERKSSGSAFRVIALDSMVPVVDFWNVVGRNH